jgi:dTMP kinase
MFITFEGPDGSGKSSQVASLAEYLDKQGFKVLVTREPGGTAIGDQIRAILSDLGNEEMHPRAETLLFLAARAQIVEQVILPALAEGRVVLCDRYADSTLAYQGYGHQHDLQQIQTLLDFATGGLKPDLTLLLDVDVEVGLQRRATDGQWNRLDAYNLEFHRRVRQGYHHLVQADLRRWIVVDASQPADQVQATIRQIIIDRLGVTSSK